MKPEILHGSTPDKGENKRRTILPWFVGVRKDGMALDNIESDNWLGLAQLHITLEANQILTIPYHRKTIREKEQNLISIKMK